MSGLSVYTCRLANALAEHHDVSLILLDRLIPSRLYPGGHRAGESLTSLEYDERVRIAARLDWYWAGDIARAVASLRRERPDVLVLQWWTAATLHSYLALAVAARRLGIRVIVEFHEVQDTGEAGVPFVASYARRVLPRLLARVDGAIVHNEHDRELLGSSYGAAMDRLEVLVAPHGPYDHLVAPAAPAPAVAVGSASPHRRTRLLFFGLIRPYKGLEDLVVALDQMTPAEADLVEVTIAGETWEGWTLPAELIATNRHADRIRFINRYVTDAEAAELVAAADVMVLPYRRGSASGPLQVAMSAGIHVVLYAVGGLVDAVADYDGATLVEPDDVEGLRRALLDLHGRRSERFEDPHSWSATVSAYTDLATRP